MGVGFGVFKCQDVRNTKEGAIENHYDAGILKDVFSVANGKRNGLSKTYHPNGNIASKGIYKDNLKTGKWQYFNEEGNLIDESKIKNGAARINGKKLKEIAGVYQAPNGDVTIQFYQDKNNKYVTAEISQKGVITKLQKTK